MSEFTKTLVVSPLSDGRTWVLREAFSYDEGREGSGKTITVPVGFLTNFASVPRPLWSILPPWDKYGNAAVIHDFLYWEHGGRSRNDADGVFLEAMGVLGVGWLKRHLMWLAVRLFGFFAWAGRKKKLREGRVHVARRMPRKHDDQPQDLLAPESSNRRVA